MSLPNLPMDSQAVEFRRSRRAYCLSWARTFANMDEPAEVVDRQIALAVGCGAQPYRPTGKAWHQLTDDDKAIFLHLFGHVRPRDGTDVMHRYAASLNR